jgi:uncharacterized membrane protein
MKWLSTALIALSVATLAVASPRPASAAGIQMTICNQSSAQLTVIVGYHTTGVNDQPGSNVLTGPFVSQGFWKIDPGKCIPFANPFSARYMFWWGVNHAGLNEYGAVWYTSGSDQFCIPNVYGSGNSSFTFEDENASEAACEKGHFSPNGANLWVNVRKVDLLVNPTVTFTGQ